MKIDAHQHYWQYDPIKFDWIGEGMEVLKQDFLPPKLKPVLDAQGFNGCVAVQADQTLDETRWLLSLADQFDFIKGVVGWIDLSDPGVGDQLEEFADHPRFCGIRHIVQAEPDDEFMLREDFKRGISKLEKFDLVYDILIYPKHIPVASKLVEQFPNQPFILDHLAKPGIKDSKIQRWGGDIHKLAAYPNVMCKLSGMVTEADWANWSPTDFRPYLDIIFESFGTERLMFGSDWPVCLLAGSYQQVYNLVANYISQLSEDEQASILGKNAIHGYKLDN